MSLPKLIVANWKMNGFTPDGMERAKTLITFVKEENPTAFKLVLCPPVTLAGVIHYLLHGSAISSGGQDCHAQPSGAFTGDISAPMLKDVGCSYVIVGHSERRQYHKETSAEVAAKAKAAHAAGLIAIICVGESDAERMAGQAESVVAGQLKLSLPETVTAENTVVAYEPIWAIGTGKTPSTDDVASMHAFIRAHVPATMPLLYGGSVKGSNAREFLHLANVDGVLVGGASLKVDEFLAIAKASV